MATLREYFTKDFANALSVDFSWHTRDASPQDIPVKVGNELYSGARFVAYYIPKNPAYLGICASLIENLNEAIKKSNDVQTTIGFIGDRDVGLIGSDHCVVANRVYAYPEDEPNDADAAALGTFDARREGICNIFSGFTYSQSVSHEEVSFGIAVAEGRGNAEGQLLSCCPASTRDAKNIEHSQMAPNVWQFLWHPLNR